MDLFSIIWLVVVIGFMVAPAAIEKKLKQARNQSAGGQNNQGPVVNPRGEWPTPSAFPKRPSFRPEANQPANTEAGTVTGHEIKPKSYRDAKSISQNQPSSTAPTIVGSAALPVVPLEGADALNKGQKIKVGETEAEKKKFIVDPKAMIIYSAVMNPKFEES